MRTQSLRGRRRDLPRDARRTRVGRRRGRIQHHLAERPRRIALAIHLRDPVALPVGQRARAAIRRRDRLGRRERDDEQARITRLAGRAQPFEGTPDEAVGQLDAILRQAVARQMEADVPLGAFLSGGVDSSVAAALIHRAIGDQLTCVFVDHGLLRLNEGKMVLDMFEGRLHAKVVHVDASDQFLGHLAGVTDPEAKRKIIGREFVEVFQAEAKKLSKAKWLAQGTIYPDVVESGGTKTKKATTIKSHHNVGGLPETLGLKLLEPLRDLFKDEVRELGVALGLPPEMVYRHPFPGPGLGVRILGEVKREYADLLRRADAIFIEELRGTTATAQDAAAGLCGEADVGKSWYDLTSQAFAVFLPVKSVGVMGDGRTYDYVTSLRAVQTTDFMTAHWAHLPYALLGRASNRIINEVRGINRVVYDISGKPPATIEWE